jgi:hypothetical protein
MEDVYIVHATESLIVLSVGSCDLNLDLTISPSEVLVVIPSTNLEQSLRLQNIMARRAEIAATYVVALDRNRRGFVSIFNFVARNFDSKYTVYCAQDAFPGNGWLKLAVDEMRSNEVDLVAFNDGKWHGALASFGLMRTQFYKEIYSGNLFYPKYKSHAADNEVTYIAMACSTYRYMSDAVLLEVDFEKGVKQIDYSSDSEILFARLEAGIQLPQGVVRLVGRSPTLICNDGPDRHVGT